MPKTAGKTARGPGRPFSKGENGGGRGPKPGAPNAGRPPEKYLTWLADAIHSEACQHEVELILRDGNHPAFAKLYLASMDRLHGKPVQPMTVDAEVRWVVYAPTKAENAETWALSQT